MIATEMDIETLKYPKGKFSYPESATQEEIAQWIVDIELFPEKLERKLEGVEDLSLTYRPDSWSIQQIVHHCADSHMNSFLRFKWILTEENTTVKTYHEDKWAELSDTIDAPISASVKLIEGLHKRWTVLLRSLSESDFQKKGIHPDQGKEISLMQFTALYAWHCNHHLAHIKLAKESAEE